MKTFIASFTTALLSAFLFGSGYDEKGHANTPAENSGNLVKAGADALAHPGNIE